jgi:hypothetical protein
MDFGPFQLLFQSKHFLVVLVLFLLRLQRYFYLKDLVKSLPVGEGKFDVFLLEFLITVGLGILVLYLYF